jgi:hypothetical protein
MAVPLALVFMAFNKAVKKSHTCNYDIVSFADCSLSSVD